MNKKRILIGCLLFREFTGSEMYVYELAKGLLKENYEVSIVSPNIGGRLTDIAISEGIKVYNFTTLPKNHQFDLIHCQHVPVTQQLIKLYPTTKKICTIHSEVNQLENPVQHFTIFNYIAIRPEIKNHLIKNFGIPENQIEVIYNPIDDTRFNTQNTKNENAVLFVGTIDQLRKDTIFDVLKYTKETNKEFWLVGRNHNNYLNEVIKEPHVKYYDSLYNVESFVKNCSETAGILLGRTTIEGWMSGKPGWIYDIDSSGKILSKELHQPPSDIEKFHSINVVKQIKEEYKKIINL
jgi:glycosyltransferase involved in cell wall biosynthesis